MAERAITVCFTLGSAFPFKVILFSLIKIALISINFAQCAGLKSNLWLKELLPVGKTLLRLYHIGKGYANLLDHQLTLSWVGFLGVRFEVEGGCYVRNFKFDMY